MPIRLLKLIISIIVFVCEYSKKTLFRIAGKRFPGACVVLYYHDVTREQRGKFAKQMDYIKRLSKPISAEFKEPFEVGVNHVAITFDDAFASILENALPEMVKRELPFTIFVPSGYLGKNADWVTEKKVVSKTNIVMSEIQLKNLKNVNSVSIGSHSITHRDLTLIEEEDAEREILQSKKEIESIIKQNITLLSFPHGAYSDKHVELAQQAGYDRAFSILPVQILSNSLNYVTGRVRVDPSDWAVEFRLKMLGAYRWLPLAYALKQKVLSVVGFNLNPVKV